MCYCSGEEKWKDDLWAVLEDSGVYFWNWDVKTGEVNFSFRWAELIGRRPEEIEPHISTWEKLVHTDDLPSAQKALDDCLKGRATRYEAEYRLLVASGGWRWVLSRGKVVAGDEQGEPLRMAGISLDITERKQAEESLYDVDVKYKEMTERLPQIIFESDEKGCVTYANRCALESFGYSPVDLKKGVNIFQAIAPGDRGMARKNSWRILGGKDPYGHEYTALRKDGGTFPIAVYVAPIIRGDQTVGMRGIVIDITQLKQSEEDIRAAHRQLLDTIEYFPDAALIIDINGRVVAWNQAMEEMTGVRKEDIVGRGEYAYAVPLYGEPKPILIDLVIAENHAMEELYSGIKREGNTLYGEIYTPALYGGEGAYLWGKAAPLFDCRGNIIGAIESFRDITERKSTETQLRYLSLHDPLTGLHNRNYFKEKMRYLESRRNEPAGVIVCDIDGLKLVNDTMGHEKGDQLLMAAARVLKESFRDKGVVARIGGDEFAALVTGDNVAAIESLCQRINNFVDNYNKLNPELPLSISVGFSTSHDPASGVDDIFRKADNKMYREKLHRKKSTRSAIVQTLMKALEERDFATEGHAERLQNLTVSLAGAVGLPQRSVADLKLLARFHDIGKVGIPDRILLKPGPLTEEEYVEMQRHSEIGCRIAMTAPDLAPIADWILKHHEWWNGKGYPLGIKGKEIPLECRILAIVDAYDAMTSDRPYREAMTVRQALNELARYAGTQFDPQLVEKFISIIKVGLKIQMESRRRVYLS